MGALKHILEYEILQGKIINAIVFPVAYNFRDNVKEGDYLWGYLHDGHMYGDEDYRPNMKDGFAKAWLWAMRNPLHNKYYSTEKPLKEENYSGWSTCKFEHGAGAWRTYKTETGSRNGKYIDFQGSIFGEQNIEFDMVFEDGTIQKGFRRSKCMPTKVGNKIIVHSERYGHERGLIQSSFNYAVFKGKENLEGFEEWKQLEMIKIIV